MTDPAAGQAGADDDRLARIRAALAPLHATDVDLFDDSALHRGHAGARDGGGHYRLRIVSPRFSGLPRMARHRLVYDLLSTLMQRDIHALSLVLLAPDDPGPPPAPSAEPR